MIPSYDDLTPAIPDVVESQAVSQLTIFLRNDLPQGSAGRAITTTQVDTPDRSARPPSTLYACLRAADRELPALLAIARDFSPRVMRVSDVEVVLDVSGLGRLIGEPPAIERELRRAVIAAELAAAVAIAPTQTAARLLAASGSSGSALSDLPVALLQPLETLPPAMNHRDRDRPFETCKRWGIATLGDLAALPAPALSSRLGRRGVALHRLARGLDPRPFVPDADTPRYVGRLELEWPVETLEPLSFVFARLLDPLSAALERADRGAVAVHLDLRLTDRRTCPRLLQLPAPMRDARVLRTLLLLDLESHPPSAAVDVVTIELDPAPARITQFSLLERALPSPETLSTLIARLSALSGESRVGAAALLDTYAPGAFEMKPFTPDQAAADAQARGLAAGASDDAAPGGLTGGSLSEHLVLRRQRCPPAIRVSVQQGRPVHLAASKRGLPHGAVTQAAGPWRTSGAWWNPGAAADGAVGKRIGGAPRAWNKDEWDVALSSGAVCRISQDRTTQCWFLEGVYD